MRYFKKISVFIFFLIGIFLFVDCGKKYPDDPFITPRSSKRRLQYKAGDPSQWSIVTVKVNGVDMTETYNDSLQSHSFSDIHFRFNFNVDQVSSSKRYDFCYVNYWGINRTLDAEIGVWQSYLEPKNSLIGFTKGTDFNKINDSSSNKLLSNLLYYPWNIKRLYHKFFIIECKKNSNSYEVHFKR